jgi:hypothetical protein
MFTIAATSTQDAPVVSTVTTHDSNTIEGRISYELNGLSMP